jgi:ligand-binding sensor domain-containing protein
VLGISASSSAITAAETSSIRANLTYDSKGFNTSSGGHFVPDGTVVAFYATGGTVPQAHTATDAGISAATFMPAGSGTATITATVDDQSVTVPVEVTPAVAATNVTSIEVDPAEPATVYAGVDGSGVYSTTNSGGSWSAATTQPSNRHIRALVIHPVTHSTLYTGTYGGGVYSSTDSGDHWSACANTGLANLNLLSLVSDSNGLLYAGTEDGVYTSMDGCTNWVALDNGLP